MPCYTWSINTKQRKQELEAEEGRELQLMPYTFTARETPTNAAYRQETHPNIRLYHSKAVHTVTCTHTHQYINFETENLIH